MYYSNLQCNSSDGPGASEGVYLSFSQPSPVLAEFPSKDWKDATGNNSVSTYSTWPSAEMQMKDLLFQNHWALYLS